MPVGFGAGRPRVSRARFAVTLSSALLLASAHLARGQEVAARRPLGQEFPVYVPPAGDLQLPDTNGIALAARIRALRPNLPLLAVTAQVDEATRQACHAAGMAAVVTKPVNPGRLLEALAGCLAPPGRLKTPLPEKTSGETAPPLLTDLVAAEPERLRRVLLALAGEFQNAGVELTAAASEQNHDRLRRLRHKLHSALAGLQLTELDQTFTLLLAGDWTQTSHAGTLLQQASAECSRRAAE